MNREISRLDNRIIYFPVRHHSPACARLVRELALQHKPAAILIEGPADFNPQFEQLYLPHHLPIAIYSYSKAPEGGRRGAFYPFCVYSPEWQALQVARELGIVARFIDLPWADLLNLPAQVQELGAHRYSDAELGKSKYVEVLCQKLGVNNFSLVWDTLFEIDEDMSLAEYMERGHLFCQELRAWDGEISFLNQVRESYMASRIREVLTEFEGQILVVTGGYHSRGLFELLAEEAKAVALPESSLSSGEERGIALTPYSYQRLDSLIGYEAGMPHPGFYHRLWLDRNQPHQAMLGEVATLLRTKGQIISAADLIATEQMAQGLARLRGHSQVWHSDLLDGITGALVKEELANGETSPFLEAVYTALRGHERGRLHEQAEVPPLVKDIRRLLKLYGLEPEMKVREVVLELSDKTQLEKSRFLHRLKMLGISGFTRTGGTDLTGRSDLTRIYEVWKIQWTPEYEANCIEAAIYGADLGEAARARLKERFDRLECQAEEAALLLLEAALMGLETLPQEEIVNIIREDGAFLSVARALSHLLYLYRYDQALETAGRTDFGVLLVETFERGLWLLEGLGQLSGQERELLKGIKALLETFERRGSLGLERERLVGVMHRVSLDPGQLAQTRGAASGVLWILHSASLDELRFNLRYFSDPSRLGDFLTGLFYLAREVAQREPALVLAIDQLVVSYMPDEFMEALPALRLAFSYFTPREKHFMSQTLMQTTNSARGEELAELEVSLEVAARILEFETQLYQRLAKYGLRGT